MKRPHIIPPLARSSLFGSHISYFRLGLLAHQLLWKDWMSGRLEQQHADLLLHLHCLTPDLESVIVVWLETQPFLDYVPDSALTPERNLFCSNLRLLLGLLHSQYAARAAKRFTPPEGPLAGTIKQAVDIIWARYSDPTLSLASLSANIRISERHLGRLFQQSIGRGFRQYLRDVRMKQAIELLLGSNHGVKMIAGMVGYNHSSHFGEDFRIVIGCTPLEFRIRNGLVTTR